jgi:hypothetical protein
MEVTKKGGGTKNELKKKGEGKNGCGNKKKEPGKKGETKKAGWKKNAWPKKGGKKTALGKKSRLVKTGRENDRPATTREPGAGNGRRVTKSVARGLRDEPRTGCDDCGMPAMPGGRGTEEILPGRGSGDIPGGRGTTARL